MDMPEISNQLKPRQIERFKTKLGKQAGRMMEQHIAFSVSAHQDFVDVMTTHKVDGQSERFQWNKLGGSRYTSNDRLLWSTTVPC